MTSAAECEHGRPLDECWPVAEALLDLDPTTRLCAWCRGPIAARARRDSVCCSTRCRQARHRFGRTVGRAPDSDPSRRSSLRLAYADPPYPGLASYYRDHPDYAGEVDHADLISSLIGQYDGWALSTSARALPTVLGYITPEERRLVRVAAWHRGERPGLSWGALNAWEPVIYAPGRLLLTEPTPDASRVDAGLQPRRIDSLVHGVAPMTTLPGRVIGTKPAAFCRWIFDLLGALPGDELDDLYPGSGAVSRAWAVYTGAESCPA